MSSWFDSIGKTIKWVVIIGFIMMIFIMLSNYFLSEFMCNLKIFSMTIMQKVKIWADVFFPFSTSSLRILLIIFFLKFLIFDLIINVFSKGAEKSSGDGT